MITLEEAKVLKPGTFVTFDGNESRYEVAGVDVDFAGNRIRVLVERDDHAEGMNTWFDERHLGIVNVVGDQGPVAIPAETQQSPTEQTGGPADTPVVMVEPITPETPPETQQPTGDPRQASTEQPPEGEQQQSEEDGSEEEPSSDAVQPTRKQKKKATA